MIYNSPKGGKITEQGSGAHTGLNASVVRAANEFVIIGSSGIFERPEGPFLKLASWINELAGGKAITGSKIEDDDSAYVKQIKESIVGKDSLNTLMQDAMKSVGDNSGADSQADVVNAYRSNVQALGSGSVLNSEQNKKLATNPETKRLQKVVLFRGYTAQGVNLQITANKGGSGGVALPFGAITTNLFNIAPILDTTRRAQYTGPDPLSYRVPVHLFLRSDFVKDIMHPLLLLLALTLPFRVSGNLSELFDKLAVKGLQAINSVFPIVGETLELARQFFGLDPEILEKPITTFLGECFVIAPPPPYAMFKQNTIGELTAFIGGVRLSNIVIESIDIKIPTLLVEGGLPDRLSLNINLKSLRLPTYDYIQDIFSGLTAHGNAK